MHEAPKIAQPVRKSEKLEHHAPASESRQPALLMTAVPSKTRVTSKRSAKLGTRMMQTAPTLWTVSTRLNCVLFRLNCAMTCSCSA